MSITVWELIPNQYNYDIYLCLSNESSLDTYNLLNEKYCLEFEPGINFDDTLDIVNSTCAANQELRKCVIILNKFENTIEDQTHLIHELFHMITIIADNIHMEISQTTSEAWAYFIDFYYKICVLSLSEHLENK